MTPERRAFVLAVSGIAACAFLGVYGGIRYDQLVESSVGLAFFVVGPTVLLSILALYAGDRVCGGESDRVPSGWIWAASVGSALLVAPWGWGITGDAMAVIAPLAAQAVGAAVIVRERRHSRA